MKDRVAQMYSELINRPLEMLSLTSRTTSGKLKVAVIGWFSEITNAY